ncbi:MAG: 4-hydroxybenzoate octaprenyltransferase [Rhodospirillales bacterium]|nr:4-hydroxybenzoate octaprenyltransferase [Rhodospirillales bacterium]
MAESRPPTTDIPPASWVDLFAPAALRPYLRLARLDRPIGTWLLLLPCWWSIALASDGDAITGTSLITLSALFAVGALVMRGAGCTLNDIVDRDFDGRVARTATRPIPSGDVTVRQAALFLCLQLAAGLMVLSQLNVFTFWMAVASLGLVAIYPFAKRYTYWPQLVLGLTFNWGALLGWTAIRGQLDAPAVALYAAGILWTLGYDTIYAHQDKEDDALIGIKSTALKLGDATQHWLFGFYAGAIVLIALAGYLAGLSLAFYGGLLLCALHLAWQAWRVDIHAPTDCLATFKSNRDFGLLLTAAIIAGQVL